jgi:hypothetical protein
MSPASEGVVTVFGVGLASANAVSFDVPGITANIDGTPADTTLSLSVRVDASVAPGAYGFTVHRTSLPSIASGAVVLNVRPVPTLLAIAPARVLTGQTVESFTLTGARLGGGANVIFSRAGLSLSGLTASADGTSLTGRLQVSLTMAPGPVDVSVSTPEGKSRSVVLRVDRSVPGLIGSYFAGAFALDANGLPVVPAAFPTFVRNDARLEYGVFTEFRFRPCFIGSSNCLNGSYTVRWQGNIYLQEAGSYTFALNSSDASTLHINGASVVSNPGEHEPATEQGTFVAPFAGSYPLVVTFTTNGTTPGIDLLYQPPGAPSLSLVPAEILWGDGGVSDPRLTSAVAAVSVSNPATVASPHSAVVSPSVAVSFKNPAPVQLPGGAATIGVATAVVSVRNPAVVVEPGGTHASTAAGTTVSFANPSPVTEPGGHTRVAATSAAASFANPSPVPSPGGNEIAAAPSTGVSFSNPAPIITPGGSGPLSAAMGVVGFAAGPVVTEIAPVRLSRSAGGGVLTIKGSNLQDAIAVLFENGSGIVASAPSASEDGSIVTVTVTLTQATPTGFVGVKVSTPAGVSVATAASVLEIVP